MDNLTKEQRSRTMSKIRSKWTEQEKKIHNYLKALKIRHKTHPKIEGNPDLIFSDRKIAIFLHGCFWHKCPIHYKAPKSNIDYWLPKITRNVKRDKMNSKILRGNGWRVVRIWEHQIRSGFKSTIQRVVVDGRKNGV